MLAGGGEDGTHAGPLCGFPWMHSGLGMAAASDETSLAVAKQSRRR